MIPKNKLLFFLVLILVHFASFIHSKTYYVASKGKSNGKGTLIDPFNKIAKAVRVLKPGDTCFVRGGSYEEIIVFNVSGQKGKKIVLKNYQNEKIVVLPKLYDLYPDQLMDIILETSDDFSKVMVVGHNPVLTVFLNIYTIEGIVNLPTGTLVQVEYPNNETWQSIKEAKGNIKAIWKPQW